VASDFPELQLLGSSLFGVLKSRLKNRSVVPTSDAFRRPALLFEIGSVALPAWDQ
jgi:hypothetical protein